MDTLANWELTMPASVIDRDYLQEFIDAIGADELRMLVDALKGDAAGQLRTLQALIGDTSSDDVADIEAIWRAAHRLAGVFSQFGAATVADTAQLMRAASSGAEMRSIGFGLLRICRQALDELDSVVAEIPPAGVRRAA